MATTYDALGDDAINEAETGIYYAGRGNDASGRGPGLRLGAVRRALEVPAVSRTLMPLDGWNGGMALCLPRTVRGKTPNGWAACHTGRPQENARVPTSASQTARGARQMHSVWGRAKVGAHGHGYDVRTAHPDQCHTPCSEASGLMETATASGENLRWRAAAGPIPNEQQGRAF